MDAAVDLELARRAGEEQAVPSSELQHGVTGGDTRFQLLARVADVGRPGEFWGVTLKADLADDLTVDSWVPVYAGADWHEREAWEMYGVEFVGHPGLRHMYLPTGFEGHPGRKDFPLVSRHVKPWPGIVDVEPMPGSGDDEEGEGDS
jgi:NADH-quinone oxidoreductase subunit C